MAKKNVVVLDWPDALGVLEQNGLEPPKVDGKTKIKDADGRVVDNGFLWKTAERLREELKAASVADMVAEIRRALGPGDCMKSLALVGHGTGGRISVGDGQTNQEGKRIDGDAAEWGAELAKLCRFFCKDLEVIDIFLIGCHTAVCEEGAEKLFKLAKFFKEKCAKDKARPVFRVHGTKKTIYPADVERILREGAASSDLVRVDSTADAVPDCMVPPPKDGKKKEKETTKKGKVTKDETKGSRPRAKDYEAVAFRAGSPDPRDPVGFPVPPQISVVDFLELYEYDQAFEPDEMSLDVEGFAYLLRADRTTDTLPIVMSGRAIVWSDGKEDYLYYLRDPADARTVRSLLDAACFC